MGKIQKRPVYDEKTDSIVAQEMMSVIFTVDHRYGDAAVIGPFVKISEDFILNPEGFDPSLYKDVISASEK